MQKCSRLTFLLISTIFLLFAGCVKYPHYPMQPLAMDQIHNELNAGIEADKAQMFFQRCMVPASVSRALLPYSAKRKQCIPQKRFDISANEVPAKTFFMSLVEGTPYNLVVDPNVKGTITLTLKRVTIREALQAVYDTYGYEFKKSTYGYKVLPPKLESKIFTINYLDVKRKGESLTEVTSGQISEQVSSTTIGGTFGSPSPIATGGTQSITSGSSVDTKSEADFWKDINTSLRQIIGNKEGRSVVVNSQSGVIIVHAYPPELRQITRFLDRIQSNMQRQVILEAKVLEVQLNNQFQSGIDWNLIGKVIEEGEGGIAQTAFREFENTPLKDFHSIFTLKVNGDFGALIKLLQTQGNVQIISNPRISAVNNQKALIKVGMDQFFVTGVSTTNVTSGLANNVFPTENINLTPFFSGVTLDVTPQISRTGEVILHIHPAVSQVKDQEKTIVLGNTGGLTNSRNTFILPLAQSTIRESDNIVKAKSGQVIVIGGLMQNDMREHIAGVPVLSKIPFLGFLFRRTEQLAQKIELVILLRPLITNNKVWIEDMAKTNGEFGEGPQGFHIGGLPEVFGFEAECA